MPNNEPNISPDFDVFAHNLLTILSDVSVCGPANIGKMDTVLKGLAILRDDLHADKEKRRAREQVEKEEI